MSVVKRVSGYREVETNVGDTIKLIALRELGDAARWTDIVALNSLRPPYLVDSLALAGPGVLLAGQQVLKVPAAPPPTSGVADTDSVFGTDVQLIAGRITAAPGGDMQTVSGVKNLDQAIGNALATHPGDLVYYPRYGCEVYSLIGQGGSATSDRLAAAMVARTVRADGRVARVRSTVGSIAGDTIRVSCDAVTVNGKVISATLPAAAATPGAAVKG
ncbi:MAG TPA: hypothetical protein VGC15_13080 [Acetobacteraceae bacterium]